MKDEFIYLFIYLVFLWGWGLLSFISQEWTWSIKYRSACYNKTLEMGHGILIYSYTIHNLLTQSTIGQ